VTGEIIRVEEAYWIKTPTGLETRLKVTDDTKMNSPLKKGDKVAAQVTSTGEAEAVVKMEDLPKPPPAASLPSTSAEDIRQKQSGSGH
jgi:exosome complex RNA-binding protein Csl4